MDEKDKKNIQNNANSDTNVPQGTPLFKRMVNPFVKITSNNQVNPSESNIQSNAQVNQSVQPSNTPVQTTQQKTASLQQSQLNTDPNAPVMQQMNNNPQVPQQPQYANSYGQQYNNGYNTQQQLPFSPTPTNTSTFGGYNQYDMMPFQNTGEFPPETTNSLQATAPAMLSESKTVNNNDQKNTSYTEKFYYDDPSLCAMYEVSTTSEEKNEVITSFCAVQSANGTGLSRNDYYRNKLKNKKHTKKLAEIFHEEVIEYGDCYGVRLMFKKKAIDTPKIAQLFVSKKDAAEGKICSIYRKHGISCGDRNISNEILKLYIIKAVKAEAPLRSGFSLVNGKYFFASEETLKNHNYPPVTSRSLDLNLEEHNSNFTFMKHFFEGTLRNFEDSKLAMLLTLLRMTALLTNVLADNGIRFRRFLATDTDSDMLCYMLQIYDRNKLMDPLALDQKNLGSILADFHDEAVIFSTVKDKGNAAEYLNDLYSKVYRNTDLEMANGDLTNDYIVFLSSEFLGAQMETQKVLFLSGDKDALKLQEKPSDLIKYNKAIDVCLIDAVQKSPEIIGLIKEMYSHFSSTEAIKTKPYSNDYAVIMTVYILLTRIVSGLVKLPFTEAEISEYLIEAFDLSQEHERLHNILDEFKAVLNNLVVNNQIKLLANSKLNEVKALPNELRIIYCREDLMYISNEIFEYIVSIMKLPDNPNQVRKAIVKYLKRDKSGKKETYKYSVRIYKNDESNKENVTAVQIELLDQEARSKIRENLDSVIDTQDGKERIHIGDDEMGQKFYWTLGTNINNITHFIFCGKTRCGKSCAMNYMAKQLFENGHKVIFISFKNAEPRKELTEHGFSEEFYDNNFETLRIEENNKKEAYLSPVGPISLFDLEIEETADPEGGSGTEDTVYRKRVKVSDLSADKISILYCDKYSEKVELILNDIYDYYSVSSEREVFLCVDEAHQLSHKNNSPIYKVYSIGAGNGVHILSSYQTFSQLKKRAIGIIQYDIAACFTATNSEVGKETAAIFGQKHPTQFGRELYNLPKQMCYLIGGLESSSGEIVNGSPVKIKIPDIYQ